MGDKDICPDCHCKEHTFLYDDYDYDGNDNIHSWDVVECDKCGHKFNINEDDPYAKEY